MPREVTVSEMLPRKRNIPIKLLATDLSTEMPDPDKAAEVIARLLLERWEARHAKEESRAEEGS
jgi:hypothetical protein